MNPPLSRRQPFSTVIFVQYPKPNFGAHIVSPDYTFPNLLFQPNIPLDQIVISSWYISERHFERPEAVEMKREGSEGMLWSRNRLSGRLNVQVSFCGDGVKRKGGRTVG